MNTYEMRDAFQSRLEDTILSLDMEINVWHERPDAEIDDMRTKIHHLTKIIKHLDAIINL